MSRKENYDETLSFFVCMISILAIGMRERNLQNQQSNISPIEDDKTISIATTTH